MRICQTSAEIIRQAWVSSGDRSRFSCRHRRFGAATEAAIESAGLILVNSNPLDVVKIFRLSRARYSKMIQNLWWAVGYNIVTIPLAAGVLANWGILLSPAVRALI